jgi:hypothetical protein
MVITLEVTTRVAEEVAASNKTTEEVKLEVEVDTRTTTTTVRDRAEDKLPSNPSSTTSLLSLPWEDNKLLDPSNNLLCRRSDSPKLTLLSSMLSQTVLKKLNSLVTLFTSPSKTFMERWLVRLPVAS